MADSLVIEWGVEWTSARFSELSHQISSSLTKLEIHVEGRQPGTPTEANFLEFVASFPHVIDIAIRGAQKPAPDETKDLSPTLQSFIGRVEALSLSSAMFRQLLGSQKEFGVLKVLNITGKVDFLGTFLKRAPRLEELSCRLANRLESTIDMTHGSLRSLQLQFAHGDKSKHPTVTLFGALPSLEALHLSSRRGVYVDGRALQDLLLTARRPLKQLYIDLIHAWSLSRLLAQQVPSPEHVLLDAHFLDETAKWPDCLELLTRDWKLDPTCILPLLTDGAMLQAKDAPLAFRALRTLEGVQLHANESGGLPHGWLVRSPESLVSLVPAISKLDIIGCDDLTSERLAVVLDALPHISELDLSNNHHPGFRVLKLRSLSLKTVRFTHFHALESYDVHLPALISLELDNCGVSPDSPRSYLEPITYSNFPELFLADLLRPSHKQRTGAIHLPRLQTLNLWHNSDAMCNIPGVMDDQRVKVDCSAGHPTLRELRMFNCMHLWSMTLRSVPQLREVSITLQGCDASELLWTSPFEDVDDRCSVKLDPRIVFMKDPREQFKK
ncbi:hypothetical protein DFJ77DRAFT_509898 [Powellomyces hirtus]|nr:hypothetical protein DFJ77DRAFT_509898 [Powellomyces hirtus]